MSHEESCGRSGLRIWHTSPARKWTEAHPIGNGRLGAMAAIAEMLLQSHDGCLRLLPALPDAWPAGAVTGLRARGAFELSIEWRHGRLKAAEVLSLRDLPCRVRAASVLAVACDGRPVPARTVDAADGAAVQFPTAAGKRYALTPEARP